MHLCTPTAASYTFLSFLSLCIAPPSLCPLTSSIFPFYPIPTPSDSVLTSPLLRTSSQFHLAPPIPSFLHSSSLPAATTGHFHARLITVLPVILSPIPLHTLSHLYFLPRPVLSCHLCLRPHSQVAGRGDQRGVMSPGPHPYPPRRQSVPRPHPASRMRQS